MLPIKLVRSLVLGETMNHPFHHHDPHTHPHDHDADDEHEHDEDDHHHNREAIAKDGSNLKKKKKVPLLLFLPTKELISDTFRLASIARDIGMDFHPSTSLSHLIFSWPSPSSTPSSSSSSSTTTTSSSSSSSSSTTTTSSSSSSSALLPYDAVPLPFPSLSTPTVSLSLLRYFVSLSRGLFKLVFFNLDPESEFDRNWVHDCPNLSLYTRVSSKRVGSMDDLSRDLAGHGWALFRTHKPSTMADSVYLFRKKDTNRVRVRGGGECRIREIRLPVLDFRNEVPLRILLYILLMTDDIFYLA